MSARSLIRMLEPASLSEFLVSVRMRGMICGWEMEILREGSAYSIVLQGFQTPSGILVLAPLKPQSKAPEPATDSIKAGGGENIAAGTMGRGHSPDRPHRPR